jgi:tetratricopeptide (TPR) repeat protein
VRRWWLLLCVALAAGAEASPPPEPPPARDPERRNLWRRITDPNGDEVRALVAKARLAMSRADAARAGEEDWAIEQRLRFYRDAYHLTAHARTLAPDHLEALAAFARAAEELGRTAEAIEALERSAKLTGPDRASREVVARLGAMHLRAGDTERAIRWLRLAQGPVSPLGSGLEQAYAIVHLATALAARGEVTAAIHAIANALPDRPLGHVSHETTVLTFALAVLYDRDEQRSAAFEVLDHLQSTLLAQYLAQVQLELARMRFLPPEDLHYYRALLYESADRYVEARAEWALYAAAGRPTYRSRALDHIAAIDAQRRANPGPNRRQQIAPTRAIPRRLPRP